MIAAPTENKHSFHDVAADVMHFAPIFYGDPEFTPSLPLKVGSRSAAAGVWDHPEESGCVC